MNAKEGQPRPGMGWASWSIRLKQLGLSGVATALTEAGKPLAPLLAQMMYIASPLLDNPDTRSNVNQAAKQIEMKSTPHD